jgi:hypothetical protein
MERESEMRRRSLLNMLRGQTLSQDPKPAQDVVVPSQNLPVPERPPMDISVPAIADPESAQNIAETLVNSPATRRGVLNAMRAAPMVPRIARNLQTPQIMRSPAMTPEELSILFRDPGDPSDFTVSRTSFLQGLVDRYKSELERGVGNEAYANFARERILDYGREIDVGRRAEELGLAPDLNAVGSAIRRLTSPDMFNFDANPLDIDWSRVSLPFEEPSPGQYLPLPAPDVAERLEGVMSRLPMSTQASRNYIDQLMSFDGASRLTPDQLRKILARALSDHYNVRGLRDLRERVSSGSTAAHERLSSELPYLTDPRSAYTDSITPDTHEIYPGKDFPQEWFSGFEVE